MDTSNKQFHSNFAHSFDFHCLTNFVKIINFLCMALMYFLYVYLNVQFTLEELSMDPIMVSKMLTNNIHSLQFQIQGHLQNWGL